MSKPLEQSRQQGATQKETPQVEEVTLKGTGVGRQDQLAGLHALGANERFAAVSENRWLQTHRQRYSLPYEILICIFRATQPALHECDPSIIRGPRSPWMVGLRTRKALTLVCKTWTPPATELLYADIVLRRMGQISSLACTLRQQQSGCLLSILIRSLRMDSCVVFRSCAAVVREDLKFLLRACTRLRSFSVHPLPEMHPLVVIEKDKKNYIGLKPNWLLEAGSHVRGPLGERLASGLSTLDLALDLTGKENVCNAMLMLTHATHLTSLTLGLLIVVPSGLTYPTIHLPALTALQVEFDYCFAQHIASEWRMPKLTALTCVCTGIGVVPIQPLLEAHGAKLTYVHLYGAQNYALPERSVTVLLPRLLELCPVIEHLVLPVQQTRLSALCIRSPTLRYLDFAQTEHPTIQDYKILAVSPDADAPSLQSVRFLQLSPSTLSIPMICHPSLCLPASDTDALEDPFVELAHVPDPELDDDFPPCNALPRCADGGGIVHVFPRKCMLQQAWVVAHEPLPEDDSDSDDEYFPPGWADHEVDHEKERSWRMKEKGGWVCEWGWYAQPESETDLEMSSGIDVEDYGDISSEEDGVGGDRSYDRETVLQMFRAGMEGDFLLDDESDQES